MSIEEQILAKLQQIETDIAPLKNLLSAGKDAPKTMKEKRAAWSAEYRFKGIKKVLTNK